MPAPLTPHTAAWYDRLARQQEGYYYPWTSTVAPGDGESAYTELVRQHLDPARDVLEVGCGHGVDALAFAPLCRSLRAYDRVDRYLALARAAAREAGVDNVTFVRGDARADAHGGRVRVPALERSVDLVISRRGPTHWIEDVRRFAREGAVLLQLNPLARTAPYAWEDRLPAGLQLPPVPERGADGMRANIEARLARVGLAIAASWVCDVAEWLTAPRDLYRFLTFGAGADEVPPWRAVAAALTELFEAHASGPGLELRQRRFLWRAVVD